MASKWSKEHIIFVIKERYLDGKPLNYKHVQRKEIPLLMAATRYFGGWSAAIAAAGLDYDQLRKRKTRTWTQQLIVQEIIRRAVDGLSIRSGDVQDQDKGLFDAACRHFGERGWAKALALSGIDPARRTWNQETIIKEILCLHKSGMALNPGSLRESHDSLVTAGRKVFGSWARAVTAAGLDYALMLTRHAPGWWTEQRILETIKTLEENGVRLSAATTLTSYGNLYGAAVQIFGCWSRAVEAAGINYRKHCRIWSTKAWLRKMTDAEYEAKTK